MEQKHKKTKAKYFLPESQRKNIDKASVYFGSKRIMAVALLLVVGSFVLGFGILQKSDDSQAAATVVRDNSTFTCDWNSSSGMLVEGCSPGFSYLSGNGPGGERIIRSALVDGMSNASSGVPNERVDAQGGTVPLNSIRWATGWQRITDVPSNIPEGSGWRWHLMGFWEIHGRQLEQAIIQPEIWKQNGQVRHRMNANGGSNTHRYFDIGPVNLGAWEYWEIGVNYRNDNNGWIRVYRNGQLVSSVDGVVTRETGNGYWKSANYRVASLTGKSTIDYSGVRVWTERPPVPSQVGGSSPTPAPAPTTPPPAPASQSPYGTKKTLPAKLQAEDYDNGGEGVAYHDTSSNNVTGSYRNDGVDIEPAGEGGYNVGYNDVGEWREHTVNINAGTYNITARVSSAVDGGQLRIKLDGQTLGTINVPNTGGWQNYQSVSLNNISIAGGNNKILRFETLNNYYTINWVDFQKQSSASPSPSPTPTPPPSPPPPVQIPDSNPDNPVPIPDDIVYEDDGTIIADFTGDGLNEKVIDSNNDGFIDPKTEIVEDSITNPSLTDTTKEPVSSEELKELKQLSLASGTPLNQLAKDNDPNTITIKAGPLPEAKISKPVAYTFLAFQGLAITGVTAYLAITKLAIFAGLRGRLGL